MKDRLTTAPLPLERPQGYFVLFVGRRYYLRPIILWNTRSAIGTACGLLERAQHFWNGLTGLRAP